MKLNKNLHRFDRIFRGATGLVISAFALLNDDFLQEPILEALLGIFGFLNLISFFFGWCPIYHIAGINTRSEK